MKRPSLAFGLVAFTMALLFIFTGITSAFVSSVASVAVLLFYFATKNKKIKSLLIIPTIAVAILLSSFSLFINNFLFYEKAISYDGKTHDITGTVTEVHAKYYVIRTTSVNNNEENMKMVFVPDSENNYSLYDIVFIDDAYIEKESLESHISEKCFTSVYSSNGDEKIGEKGRDLYYHILNIKNICNSRLSSYLYYDVFGVISGMLFGGTSYISDGLKADFRSSGVAHLLAVSGLHTSLWCGLFIAIFRFFKADEKHCNLLGILVLGILSVVSGFTPSVIRASFMMGITLIGPLFKKHSDSINSLGFSAGIILLINPYVAYSPSFYLSFLATTGVVLSSRYTYLINQAFKKIKLHRVLRKLCKFVYESLLISVFATLFTLPASVYYFGTVSIIAPLTNLLTVNLAFISMISVIPPLLISFVEAPFAEQLTELLFEVPDFLLNILIKIIEYMGNISYATITANKQFVYIAFILSAALICIYLLILNKLTLKTVHRRIAAVIIVLPVVLSLILSLLPFKKNTEFTIFGNTNTPNLVIRSGNHYAIINIPENLYYDRYEHLPKTANDKIDLLAITSFNSNNLQSIETITEKFNITQTMTTKFVKSIAYKFETNVFDNAEISSNFNYSFQNEINIQIIDTYGKNCAIINFNNKTIAISFSDYNDLHLIAKEAGGIDVLIISEKVPADYSVPVDTLIVCSAYDNNIDKNDKTGRIYSENFFRTSSGDITLNI